MIKTYYEVNYVIFFRYDEVDKENVEDRRFIGYFSSKKKATDAIQQCLKFDNVAESNFEIIKRRVSFEEEPKVLYQVSHEYTIEVAGDLFVDYSYIFPPKATLEEAEKLYESLRKKKKYKKSENRIYTMYPPDGFWIDELEIDVFCFGGL
ncbi:MAG: hypothetical protein FWD39_00530 [Clostridiales bacterium]|nr:hypothetical protein [Clostridiales bacterium]